MNWLGHLLLHNLKKTVNHFDIFIFYQCLYAFDAYFFDIIFQFLFGHVFICQKLLFNFEDEFAWSFKYFNLKYYSFIVMVMGLTLQASVYMSKFCDSYLIITKLLGYEMKSNIMMACFEHS